MKSYKTAAVTLILSYFRITQETYLVSIPQVGITTSADKKHAKKRCWCLENSERIENKISHCGKNISLSSFKNNYWINILVCFLTF